MRTASQKRPRGRPRTAGPRRRFEMRMPQTLADRLDSIRGDRPRAAVICEALDAYIQTVRTEPPTALAPREQLPDRIGR